MELWSGGSCGLGNRLPAVECWFHKASLDLCAQVNGDGAQQQPDNEWFEVMEEIAVGGHANELGGPQLRGQ